MKLANFNLGFTLGLSSSFHALVDFGQQKWLYLWLFLNTLLIPVSFYVCGDMGWIPFILFSSVIAQTIALYFSDLKKRAFLWLLNLPLWTLWLAAIQNSALFYNNDLGIVLSLFFISELVWMFIFRESSKGLWLFCGSLGVLTLNAIPQLHTSLDVMSLIQSADFIFSSAIVLPLFLITLAGLFYSILTAWSVHWMFFKQ